MSEPISVVLADDHPVVRDGLERYLARLPDVRVVATAGSASELEEAVAASMPSVAVVDLDMPGMQGVPSIRALCSGEHATRVVVFTMHEEDDLALDVLEAGAMAYLNKARDPAELATAIRSAHAGRRYLTDVLSRAVFRRRDAEPVHESFSPRERQVFDMLVSGRSPKAIARELQIAVSTVHTYTERIKFKLDLDTVPQIVRYAFEHRLA